jgi:hypothetical protein
MPPLLPPLRSRLMRPTPLRLLFVALTFVAVAGCSSGSPTRACEGNAEYLTAVERPPLRLPPEITPTERMQPLAIPPVDPNPTVLDPPPRCLDQPPHYFARKDAVADPAEAVVRDWNSAWAARQPDAVIKSYSATFQVPGAAGSSQFLDQREQQVATGPVPDPTLEDVTVTPDGSDRRTVTFVQRFGDGAVRKELTLAKEPAGWRIVSERTIEVP